MKHIKNPNVTHILEIAWKFSSGGAEGSCCADLSLAEVRTLQAVSQRVDCSVQAVGKHLGFTKSGATRIVNRLEKQGFLQKERSAHDGRVCCVTLTDKGAESLAQSEQAAESRLEKALAKVTPEKRKEVLDAIKQMATALESLEI